MQKYDTTQIAHINNEGRPLCNQDGDYLHLCEPVEFERLPKECRYKRCEQLFRHCFNAPNSKQHLLTEISRRTPDQDSWCPVIDLCKRKTEAELTSLKGPELNNSNPLLFQTVSSFKGLCEPA
jgi:hypothetical protein